MVKYKWILDTASHYKQEDLLEYFDEIEAVDAYSVWPSRTLRCVNIKVEATIVFHVAASGVEAVSAKK